MEDLLRPEPTPEQIRLHARVLANRLPSNLDGSCELEEAIAIISQAIRDGIACEGVRCSNAVAGVRRKHLAAWQAAWQTTVKAEASDRLRVVSEISQEIGEVDPRYVGD